LRAVARVPAKTCYSLLKLLYIAGAFAEDVCSVAPSVVPGGLHPVNVASLAGEGEVMSEVFLDKS